MVPRRQESVLQLSPRAASTTICMCSPLRAANRINLPSATGTTSIRLCRPTANGSPTSRIGRVIPSSECLERTAAKTTLYALNSGSIAVPWESCEVQLQGWRWPRRGSCVPDLRPTARPMRRSTPISVCRRKSVMATISTPRDSFSSICHRARCASRRCEGLSFNRQFKRWRSGRAQ